MSLKSLSVHGLEPEILDKTHTALSSPSDPSSGVSVELEEPGIELRKLKETIGSESSMI